MFFFVIFIDEIVFFFAQFAKAFLFKPDVSMCEQGNKLVFFVFEENITLS